MAQSTISCSAPTLRAGRESIAAWRQSSGSGGVRNLDPHAPRKTFHASRSGFALIQCFTVQKENRGNKIGAATMMGSPSELAITLRARKSPVHLLWRRGALNGRRERPFLWGALGSCGTVLSMKWNGSGLPAIVLHCHFYGESTHPLAENHGKRIPPQIPKTMLFFARLRSGDYGADGLGLASDD